MKKGVFWSVAMVLIVALLSMISIAINKRMITGSVRDLEKVTITIPDFFESRDTSQYVSKTFVLETDEELAEIHNVIKATKNVRFGSFEGEGFSPHDGKFFIDFIYSTGENERLKGGEGSADIIYRDNVNLLFLKRFLVGDNQNLSDYIKALMSE